MRRALLPAAAAPQEKSKAMQKTTPSAASPLLTRTTTQTSPTTQPCLPLPGIWQPGAKVAASQAVSSSPGLSKPLNKNTADTGTGQRDKIQTLPRHSDAESCDVEGWGGTAQSRGQLRGGLVCQLQASPGCFMAGAFTQNPRDPRLPMGNTGSVCLNCWEPPLGPAAHETCFLGRT